MGMTACVFLVKVAQDREVLASSAQCEDKMGTLHECWPGS